MNITWLYRHYWADKLSAYRTSNQLECSAQPKTDGPTYTLSIIMVAYVAAKFLSLLLFIAASGFRFRAISRQPEDFHGDFILEVVRRAASRLRIRCRLPLLSLSGITSVQSLGLTFHRGWFATSQSARDKCDVVRCCFDRNCVGRTPLYFNY
jgi:hypothetical protein